MTIGEALAWGNKKLSKKSDSPALDAEILLAFVLKKKREWLYTHSDKTLSWWKKRHFFKLIKKREHLVPIAYLTRHKEFFKLDFFVNKHVLIPRPETETMISAVYEIVKYNPKNFVICDIGTGSGNIAVTLATYLPQTTIIASDISDYALKVAKINAKKYRAKKIKFVAGNLWLPVEKYLNNHPLLAQKRIIITANLPYLTKDQITDTLKHEPEIALDGGQQGLDLYKELFKQIMLSNITPNHIFIEINPEQKIPTLDFQRNLLKIYKEEVIKDLSGRDRILHFSALTDYT